MDRWRIKSFLVLVVCACGRDPILDRAEELGASTSSPPEEAAQPSAPMGGSARSGRGVEWPRPPASSRPGLPPPGERSRFDGPTVHLAGAVLADGWTGGALRVEVFDGDQRDTAGVRPAVVAFALLDAPGPFSLEVPRQVGQVWIGATADENRSGRPDDGDLVGWYDENPVAVDSDRQGLAIRLLPMAGAGGGRL